MSVSDPVADMLTKIRNASRAKLEKVDIFCSKIKVEIVKVLKNEGFIKNYKRVVEDNKPIIRVFLRYDDAEKSAIHGVVSVSKPGRRVYYGYRSMPRVLNGYGVLIVSTSRGVLTGEKAFINKVGGEAICKVW